MWYYSLFFFSTLRFGAKKKLCIMKVFHSRIHLHSLHYKKTCHPSPSVCNFFFNCAIASFATGGFAATVAKIILAFLLCFSEFSNNFLLLRTPFYILLLFLFFHHLLHCYCCWAENSFCSSVHCFLSYFFFFFVLVVAVAFLRFLWSIFFSMIYLNLRAL